MTEAEVAHAMLEWAVAHPITCTVLFIGSVCVFGWVTAKKMFG